MQDLALDPVWSLLVHIDGLKLTLSPKCAISELVFNEHILGVIQFPHKRSKPLLLCLQVTIYTLLTDLIVSVLGRRSVQVVTGREIDV